MFNILINIQNITHFLNLYIIYYLLILNSNYFSKFQFFIYLFILFYLFTQL